MRRLVCACVNHKHRGQVFSRQGPYWFTKCSRLIVSHKIVFAVELEKRLRSSIYKSCVIYASAMHLNQQMTKKHAKLLVGKEFSYHQEHKVGVG